MKQRCSRQKPAICNFQQHEKNFILGFANILSNFQRSIHNVDLEHRKKSSLICTGAHIYNIKALDNLSFKHFFKASDFISPKVYIILPYLFLHTW